MTIRVNLGRYPRSTQYIALIVLTALISVMEIAANIELSLIIFMVTL